MLLLFPGTENQTEETFFCTEKHWSSISFFLKEVAGAEDGRECVVGAGGVFSWWVWFGQIHPSLRRTLLSTSEVLKHGRENFFFSVVGPYGQILKPEHASFVKQYTLFGNPRNKPPENTRSFCRHSVLGQFSCVSSERRSVAQGKYPQTLAQEVKKCLCQSELVWIEMDLTSNWSGLNIELVQIEHWTVLDSNWIVCTRNRSLAPIEKWLENKWKKPTRISKATPSATAVFYYKIIVALLATPRMSFELNWIELNWTLNSPNFERCRIELWTLPILRQFNST